MAGSRHSQHEAKGRNESRERRAVDEPQAARAMARSWDVKMGRVVFLLPGRSDWLFRVRGGLAGDLLCAIVPGLDVVEDGLGVADSGAEYLPGLEMDVPDLVRRELRVRS